MLENLKNKILQVRKAHGVEVCILPDDSFRVNTATVKLIKGRIVKESERHFEKGLSALENRLDKGLPIALSISGKGVLYKKAPSPEPPASPIEFVLPTANPDEFFVETGNPGGACYIAICRKELLHKVIDALIEKGFNPVSVSLYGIRDLDLLLNLAGKEQTVDTATYRIRLNGQDGIDDLIPHAVDEEDIRTEVSLGDQYLRTPSVVPFLSASALLVNPLDGERPGEPARVKKQRADHIYFLWFRAALWTGLIFIFSLLLVNFMVYNYYFSRNKELQTSHAAILGQLEKAGALKKEIAGKEDYIMTAGWDSASRLSFYGDRIAGSLPSTILLTSMRINPVRASDFIDHEMTSFQKDTIELTGTCEDPTEIGEMVANLKNTGISRNVVIRNYTYKKETGIGSFAMELVTK